MTVIWLVDDDPAILRGLGRLLGAEGFETRAYQAAAEFLAAHDPSLPGCAIVDLGLQDGCGLAVQEQLAADGRTVIFLTGQGSIPTAVQAMRAGAVDFLTKPVDANSLLSAVGSAIAADSARRSRASSLAELRQRLATLTPREHEVLQEIVSGRLNKQIAYRLGAAEKTIKVHRGRVMHKMGVRSVAELVKLMARLQDGQLT
jgi:FixJ family two-component response regulator